MDKSTKSQRIKEKTWANINHPKQTTLDNIPIADKTGHAKAAAPEQKKIEITTISTSTSQDDLVLKVGFRLMPSRTAFSRVTSELYFDKQKIDSLRLRIIQGPLAGDESEYSSVLDMTGISKGQHILRVEMYESWSTGEKLTSTFKEVTVKHTPLRKKDRLIKVPIIKRVAGADLAIVSDTEKRIYREIEENMKKEANSKRDKW